MTRQRDNTYDEAINWTVRLDADDVTFEEQQLFLQWLEADPRNRLAFEEAEDLWSGLSELPAESAQRLRSYAYLPVSRLDWGKITGGIRRFFSGLSGFSAWAVATTAVAVTVLAVGLFYYLSPPEPVEYQTATGEQKTVTLEDGTEIHLNTKTKIAVRMTKDMRSVSFISGEAFFSVARGPDWPFVIDTGNGEIRVVGTQFDVYKNSSNDVTVSVIKGIVKVTDDDRSDGAGPKWNKVLSQDNRYPSGLMALRKRWSQKI